MNIHAEGCRPQAKRRLLSLYEQTYGRTAGKSGCRCRPRPCHRRFAHAGPADAPHRKLALHGFAHAVACAAGGCGEGARYSPAARRWINGAGDRQWRCARRQDAGWCDAGQHRCQARERVVCQALVARSSDDAIGQINTGLVSDGYHLAIAEGTELAKPVEIQILGNEGSHTRLAADFGKGVKANNRRTAPGRRRLRVSGVQRCSWRRRGCGLDH